MRNASPSARRVRAVESFQSAAECIGKIEPGISVFAITRGQWSMIDAILATLDQVGPAKLSVWTWTIADYEIQVFERLMQDRRVEWGRLVIDYGARNKNSLLIQKWKGLFGNESVRYVKNHAKIATIETGKFRLLLRGSMNLNFNPRFEQFDLTEGGPDFDLVKEIENGLPVLGDHCGGDEVYKGSKIGNAFDKQTLNLFTGVKVWNK